MSYQDLHMRRLMNRNAKIYDLFKEGSRGSTDFGRAALETIYKGVVSTDPNLMKEYMDMGNLDEPEHHVVENSITNNLRYLCDAHGWKGFVEGLALFAKNKEATLKKMGLVNAAEGWQKISRTIASLPKNPQM